MTNSITLCEENDLNVSKIETFVKFITLVSNNETDEHAPPALGI